MCFGGFLSFFSFLGFLTFSFLGFLTDWSVWTCPLSVTVAATSMAAGAASAPQSAKPHAAMTVRFRMMACVVRHLTHVQLQLIPQFASPPHGSSEVRPPAPHSAAYTSDPIAMRKTKS